MLFYVIACKLLYQGVRYFTRSFLVHDGTPLVAMAMISGGTEAFGLILSGLLYVKGRMCTADQLSKGHLQRVQTLFQAYI